VYLVRNERHFCLYDFAQGRRFEPDFVLLSQNKNSLYHCYKSLSYLHQLMLYNFSQFPVKNPLSIYPFVAGAQYQILLDSVQGRSPSIAFLPIVSLPEVENWIETWSISQTFVYQIEPH
jgi:hypothetical protein